ncbi:MAG: ThuA domain-containing protein [Gemmataceae bacterium]
MKQHSLSLVAAIAFVVMVFPSLAVAGDKKPTDKKPLRIHIISGAREYKSEPSLKEFSKFLKKKYNVTITASWGHDGIRELKNLDALKSADLLLLFARRMRLVPEQMDLIRTHWMQGKPIVGIRTASHAFSRDVNKTFDLKVLGNNYKGHYGNQKVQVTNIKGDHPILKGVKPFQSYRLYKTGPLPKTTTVLQEGSIGNQKHPVTLINSYKGGRMFYTSLGVVEDFDDPNFRRMLVNAIFWTTRRTPK